MTNSPVADLTYRGYDGPLAPPVYRWWAIAVRAIKLGTKKKGFWIAATASGYWYMLLVVVLFIMDLVGSQGRMVGAKNPALAAVVWKDQFLTGFGLAQLFFFILALLLGTGSIANDNRSNALFVYLSKPCSRFDYVLGKWLGIFVPLSLAALVPMVTFYVYGILSFRDYGFFSSDPWLLPKLVLLAAIAGAVHASASLGISSLFRQGRLAGATYAAVYFLGEFFVATMSASYLLQTASGTVNESLARLSYLSLAGIQTGMAKIVLGTSGSDIFSFAQRGRELSRAAVLPTPPLVMMMPIFVAVVLLGFWVAWSRVKAVEIVG